MQSAITMFGLVPFWYFELLGQLSRGYQGYSLPAWIGVVGLVLGVAEGIRRREKRLLWFLISLLLTQAFAAASGLFRGQLDGPPLQWGLSIFMIAQIGLTVFLVMCFKGARLPAAGLGAFCLSYAWIASFLAAMSFADVWI